MIPEVSLRAEELDKGLRTCHFEKHATNQIRLGYVYFLVVRCDLYSLMLYDAMPKCIVYAPETPPCVVPRKYRASAIPLSSNALSPCPQLSLGRLSNSWC